MTYRSEFPEYPVDAMPKLPEGFNDQSWHNDVCPHFDHDGARLQVWIDFPEKSDREFPDADRFTVSNMGEEGYTGDVLFQSEDYAETLLFLADMLQGKEKDK